MTVLREMTTRPLVRNVRFARVRRGVCEASDPAVGKGPEGRASPLMTRAGKDGGGSRTRCSPRQPSKTATSFVVEPFELQ